MRKRGIQLTILSLLHCRIVIRATRTIIHIISECISILPCPVCSAYRLQGRYAGFCLSVTGKGHSQKLSCTCTLKSDTMLQEQQLAPACLPKPRRPPSEHPRDLSLHPNTQSLSNSSPPLSRPSPSCALPAPESSQF